METKIIKVTNKGQISLPIKIREMLNIEQGDELIVIKSDNSIVLKKVKKDDFSDLLKHSEKVAEELWNNDVDEVWNDV
ncbi:MAG: AbrB/MazE/SpoVT family DNA-binding domain-containing protein [Candidatus Marinimicrobia bacterium]|nr:AbrB/MazE/SpoVT family DNA-binding domain-containing protein [Candidatus Neomarinimicrobiota bacterium]